jgi:hypothetical protein
MSGAVLSNARDYFILFGRRKINHLNFFMGCEDRDKVEGMDRISYAVSGGHASFDR